MSNDSLEGFKKQLATDCQHLSQTATPLINRIHDEIVAFHLPNARQTAEALGAAAIKFEDLFVDIPQVLTGHSPINPVKQLQDLGNNFPT